MGEILDLQSTPTESLSPQWAISYVQASKYLKQAERNLGGIRDTWLICSKPQYWTNSQKERLRTYFQIAIRSCLLALDEIQKYPELGRSERKINAAEKTILRSVDHLADTVDEVFLETHQWKAAQERRKKAREEALARMKERPIKILPYPKLRAKLKEKNLSLKDLAENIGMPKKRLWDKLGDSSSLWWPEEKEAVLDYLGVDRSEMDDYFPPKTSRRIATDETQYLHCKLRGYLRLKGIHQCEVYQALGMDRNYFTNRMLGKQAWKPGDPEMILNYLGIDLSEKDKYFPKIGG